MATKAAVIWRPCADRIFVFDSEYVKRDAIERHLQVYSDALEGCDDLGAYTIIKYRQGRDYGTVTAAMGELPDSVQYYAIGLFRDSIEDSFRVCQKAKTRSGHNYTVSQVLSDDMEAMGFSNCSKPMTMQEFENSLPF